MAPVLVLLVVIFWITSRGFLSAYSVQSLLLDTSVLAVAALGSMLVFLVSGIDLSVGATVTGTSTIAAIVGQQTGNVALSLLAALVMGAALGAINGTLIGYARFVPFIVTLAMSLVVASLCLFASSEIAYKGVTAGAVRMLDPLVNFGLASTGGVPHIFPVMVVVVVAVAVLVGFTKFGRQIRLVGQNEEAARFSGLKVPLIKLFAYTIAGLLSGISGCLIGMRLGAGMPVGGEIILIQAITAAIIGGTTLLGGHGGVIGTVLGAGVIIVLNQGLASLGFEFFDQFIVLGFVILLGTQISRLWASSRRS
jgi:ribose transport system permease protein